MVTPGASNSILIIAGEPSGDLHGAGVVRELQRLRPDVQVFGIGGEQMARAGQEQFFTTKEMAILGFTEVVRHLPFLLQVKKRLLQEVRRRRPACAVLIDYPGFNLRFARHLKKLGVPVFYYIAPQVWAWGAKRIPEMARLLDHLAVVFQFEVPLFERAGLPATFVGHPLLDVLQPELDEGAFRRRFGLAAKVPVLGLLPGSRNREVRALLPEMLATARRLRRELPALAVVIGQSPNVAAEHYSEVLRQSDAGDVHLASGITYSVMAHSTACMVASGTATLETACFATPLVVVYRVSRLSYELARRLVKLKNIGLVNIVAGRAIAPELIQGDFTAQRAAQHLLPLLRDPAARAAMREALLGVRESLGEPGASERVARLVKELAWPGQN